MNDFRCRKCQKLLGKYRECRELEIKCPRCGTTNILAPAELRKKTEEANLEQDQKPVTDCMLS